MLGSRALKPASFALAIALFSACSALTSFDGLTADTVTSGASDARADAISNPTSDASSDSGESNDATTSGDSAIDSGRDATVGTVVFTEGFETGCDNSYGSYEATLTPSNTAHSGSKSCMVCFSGADDYYTIDHDPGGAVPMPGQSFHGEAWVMSASASTTQVGGIALRLHEDTPFSIDENQNGVPQALTTSWQRVTVEYNVTKSGADWDFYVGAGEINESTPTGDCFLVDDVLISRTQ